MKTFLYPIIAFLIIISSVIPVFASTEFSCANVTEIPLIECEALVAFYNSTNGPVWAENRNWLLTDTPSNWQGITVTSGHVTEIKILSTLPRLEGSLPHELGSLSNLMYLDLSGNLLTGSIPPELGNLSNLTHLLLYDNQLSGSIPPELGNLTNLNNFVLYSNQLSGNIPPELGNLIGLTDLILMDNLLSGSIPPELGNLINLISIHLERNQLTGSLPPELGKLVNLGDLHLDDNQLTGSIPPELDNLSHLSSLYLTNNQLSGNIPPELGNLANLGILILSGNQLNGSIPSELGRLTQLWVLVLSDNQLDGSIPPEVGNLTNLLSLTLNDNQLSGSIPNEIGNLRNLELLWLHDNLLQGDIPPTLTQVSFNRCWGDCLYLDYNLLHVPVGYPEPGNPLHAFLNVYDHDWYLHQGFQKLIGSEGGELTSLDGKTDILFPAGAVVTDTTFTFMPQPALHHSSGLLGFGRNSFEFTAKDSGGNPVITFNLPLTVTLTYTDLDISSPEDTLGLYYWNVDASTWEDAITTCPDGLYTRDPSGNKLALSLCHLTEFGLFGIPLHVFIPLATS